MHRDGSPGLLYLRLRVEKADPRLRPVRVDLPLCTASRKEAAARALMLIKSLRTLGVGVLGKFPPPQHTPQARQPRTTNAKKQLPPYLPGMDKWV